MRRRARAIAIALVLIGTPARGDVAAQNASAPAPRVDQLIAWLDAPETQWVATARLQEIPQAALPVLLRPGRVASGPHDQWTAPMLALAKIGEPAIPALLDRLLTILRTRELQTFNAAHPLIKVLGSMGPRAVPALVEIAAASQTPYMTVDALEEIVRLEPRTTVYGQYLSPWVFWRPADNRLDELERQLAPLLPRVRQVMERAIKEWKPQAPAPQRPAAYLLARWGSGDAQSRGHEVLVQLAEADEPFYRTLETIRALYALRAPETVALIRATAARVPENDELRGQYLLHMATALHQLDDPRYTDLVDRPLHDSKPYNRVETAQFLASTGDLSNVPRLQSLLDDEAEWNGRTVASVAQDSLRQLTTRKAGRGLADVDAVDAREAGVSTTSIGANGFGPLGTSPPDVVTQLLRLVQRSVPGAMERLERCLTAPSAHVRMYGALALSAYDKPRAIEALARDAEAANVWDRRLAAEFLLRLGDARGIPARLEALEGDDQATRSFACRDLRVYSQLPLRCEASAWRAWWNESSRTFRVRSREAALDLEVFPLISPIGLGGRTVR